MNPAPSPFLSDPLLLQALEKRSGSIPCDEERILFRQGDPCSGVFIIYSGEARLEMKTDCGEVVLSFLAPAGSLLGLPAVLTNQPYSLSAIAFQGARVGFIVQSHCLQLLQSDPSLSFKALQVIAAETRAARREILSIEAEKRRPVEKSFPCKDSVAKRAARK